MFAQSLAVARRIRLTVTTHNVDGSMTAFGPAARKRGLHGPRPPHGTPTHVSGTLTILAVALGSCHAFMRWRRAAPASTFLQGRARPKCCVQLALRCVSHLCGAIRKECCSPHRETPTISMRMVPHKSFVCLLVPYR